MTWLWVMEDIYDKGEVRIQCDLSNELKVGGAASAAVCE